MQTIELFSENYNDLDKDISGAIQQVFHSDSQIASISTTPAKEGGFNTVIVTYCTAL